ncbi:type VI secretion system contractile sheath large subunit [Paracoccus cavernae]|uniref:Type VI secretion system contractile sheath large subunit n=1 Tax=Paracoccus cavernae TaxID=1571207 RepID=A0ABT8DB03_9RHOB|nr:type VI secretion system contractile sheath large subunit [Paracoccus cavernae]
MAHEAQVESGRPEALAELEGFSDILRQTIKPRTEVAAREVDNAVVALVREALDDDTLIADDVIDTIDAMLSKLDQKLTDQLNAVMHHEEFQKLESSWRGLAYTVNNSETDASLRVKVMNVSRKSCSR